MNFGSLEKATAAYRDELLRRRGRMESLLEEINRKTEQIKEITETQMVLEQVEQLFTEVDRYARSESKIVIERLVTSALTLVFESDLEFEIELPENKSEAEFYVKSTYGGTQQVRNQPGNARGGGVVDVIALALRVALLESIKPRIGGPLVLDEPGKHVSAEFSGQIVDFLNTVCASFGRQIILVTHNQALAEAASTAYRIEMINGESVVIDNFRVT